MIICFAGVGLYLNRRLRSQAIHELLEDRDGLVDRPERQQISLNRPPEVKVVEELLCRGFVGEVARVGTGQISEEACLFYYAFIFCSIQSASLHEASARQG